MTKKTVNGVAAIAASSEREGGAPPSSRLAGSSGSAGGSPLPEAVLVALPTLAEPGCAALRNRPMDVAATATPTTPAATIAPRHPARAASTPPTAGPNVCPDISALENSAIFAPRRSAPAAVAKAYMPVVFVRAEAQPISAEATSAWASEPAVANSVQAAASEIPAPASPRLGETEDAIRPAGKSVSRRPSPNAAVSKPRSPAESERSAPMSGSSGTRMNEATATANTTPPASARETPARCSSDAKSRISGR
jgi:hypothetical protein